MSFAEYQSHGWRLCRIEPGKKAPLTDDWHTKPITEEDIADIELTGGGCGLMHALSGTCALDIDNLEAARAFLGERGVDVDALMRAPEAVMITSGRPNRGKLLYRMKHPMRTVRPKESGIELRCATSAGKSVQDVLPPTIHPITKKPYAWVYGDPILAHWSNPPPIPANLLAVWRQLAAETPTDNKTPTAPRAAATIDTIRKAMYQRIKREKLDVSNHDDWLKIGMALHDQTGGAQDGLELWDEWSATDESVRDDGTPRYQGIDAIKVRYVSFSSGEGKHVVSLVADVAQVPADAEEFDVEPEAASDEETTAELLKQQGEMKRAEAQAELEKRLVYVRKVARYFDIERHALILSDSDLRHQFRPMMPRRAKGKIDPVKLLEESTTKRSVEAVGFHPGEDAIFKYGGDLYANAYRNRLPKPIKPTAEELEKIDWLFDRISDVSYRDWLRQFYAHVVQHPGVKIRSAPLIWSETQGNGKSTLAWRIPQLLVGAHYSKEVTYEQLDDTFNGFLSDTWHVSLKEFRAGSRGERDRITKKVEMWIADDAIPVRNMQQVAYTIPNHLFVTASTNADDAASITNDDRKWAIHELRASKMTAAEIKWIHTEFLDQPRAPAVLRHYFLNAPIIDFRPNAPAIVTEDRRQMAAASTSSDVELMQTAFEERSGLFSRDVVMVPEVMTWIHKNTTSRPNMHRVGKLLAKEPFQGQHVRIRVGESRYNCVIVRNHEKWQGSPGKEVMAHIQGLDEDASVEPEITDDELLA